MREEFQLLNSHNRPWGVTLTIAKSNPGLGPFISIQGSHSSWLKLDDEERLIAAIRLACKESRELAAKAEVESDAEKLAKIKKILEGEKTEDICCICGAPAQRTCKHGEPDRGCDAPLCEKKTCFDGEVTP